MGGCGLETPPHTTHIHHPMPLWRHPIIIANCTTCLAAMHYIGRGRGLTPGTVARATRTLCQRCADKSRHRSKPNTTTWPGRADSIREDGIIDEVAVKRACLGDKTLRLTLREMAAAIDHLTDTWYSAEEIGDVLGINPRSVTRSRAKNHADMPDRHDLMAAA